MKLKEPPGQALAETVAVTDVDRPGTSVPLDGLKVTPDKLLDTDQFISPCEPSTKARVKVHV